MASAAAPGKRRSTDAVPSGYTLYRFCPGHYFFLPDRPVATSHFAGSGCNYSDVGSWSLSRVTHCCIWLWICQGVDSIPTPWCWKTYCKNESVFARISRGLRPVSARFEDVSDPFRTLLSPVGTLTRSASSSVRSLPPSRLKASSPLALRFWCSKPPGVITKQTIHTGKSFRDVSSGFSGWLRFSPRTGRQIVAQGASPGTDARIIREPRRGGRLFRPSGAQPLF